MKIISYQKLMELPQVVSYQRDKLIRDNVINLDKWQHELIAIIGGQQASQAFIKNVTRLGNQPADAHGDEQARAALVPGTTIFGQLYRMIAGQSPHLPGIKRAALTDAYLAAAYLQPYQSWTPEEVPAAAWKQLLLALTFAMDQKIMVLPDVFAEASPSEKALLLGVIRNLRQIRGDNQTIFIQTRQLQEALLLADRVVVLEPTAAGTIGEVIPVFFREPRNSHTLLQLPAFKALRKRLRYLLTDALAGEDLVSLSPSPTWS